MSTRTSRRVARLFNWGLAATLLVLVSLPLQPADARRKKEPEEMFRPTLAQPVQTAPANGAIFQASYGYSGLTEGNRAARVGDILTILLVEQTYASKQASADTKRNADIGLVPPISGPFSILSADKLKASGGSSFKGDGKAQQSNQLSGEVTVTVAEVYPNGVLRVVGEKQLTLNRGDEFVRISGLVRPADISIDNRVLSTRVADARITYSGKGEIARASRQGWLSRFFSILSPF